MILYFLKVAWRNLLKYKAQSVISILGLAIGFMAFFVYDVPGFPSNIRTIPLLPMPTVFIRW